MPLKFEKKFEIETMHKVTKIELELITDPDMYIFFEKGTKDGYSYISNGDSKGSNKYLKSYDEKQEPKHIKYFRRNYFIWLCSK